MWYLVDLDCFFDSKRQLVLALLASTSLALGGATSARADVSILVDAAAVKSESGDDLATVQGMFQGANAPSEPWSDPQPNDLKQIITDLKMKRLRFLQSDVLCDLDASNNLGSFKVDVDGNGSYTFTPQPSLTPGGCNMLDWTFPWSFGNGLSLHVAVASFMPPSFMADANNAPYNSAESWPSQARYQIYAKKLVRYIVTQAFDKGAQSVIFEVSNELDGAERTPEHFSETNPAAYSLKPLGPFGRWLWWINPDSYTLHQWPAYQANTYPYNNFGLSYPYEYDMRRLDHGILPMHKIFAEAIDTVRTELASNSSYSGKTIEIAGPAFTSRSFYYYPGWNLPTLEEVFLDQTLTPNLPFSSALNRFSFHFYGSLDYAKDPTTPFALFRQVVTTVRNKYPGLKLFLSEWGPSEASDGDINQSHKGAAWAAAFLTEAVAQGISMGSYLILEDGQGDPKAEPFLTQASLMHKYTDINKAVHYLPKPAANVFRMFALMTGTRRPVTLSTSGTSSNLGAFAVSDPVQKTASIVVFNYNPTLVFGNADNSLPDTPENFSVEIDNLPLPDGMVTVQHYLVDSTHSNLAVFLKNPDQSDPSLQSAEPPFSVPVQNGKVLLPASSLKLGVTFFRIQG
ncbi:hypothetical protein AYJ54_12075 [Bradyrhizobium centrolobii]|uniref:Uncharacterized protein n=2 Tax=Bradyrhizobium centrolobii TaxID=1505087 RepID=A0A176YT87_9BRAD|nr:hypothetical protein AYJ54_12075 [Bradyrhizobium centrolobii]